MRSSPSDLTFHRSLSATSGDRIAVHPAARTRLQLAAVLTAIAMATGVVMALVFGPIAITFVVLSLPVPLALLWLSADVVRMDELASKP